MEEINQRPVDRRRFLAKVSVAAGTAWAAPLLISAPPAAAASLQSPPPPPTIPTQTTQPVGFAPEAVAEHPTAGGGRPNAPLPAQAAARDRTLPATGQLAETGADLDRLTEVGVATLAAGVGLRVWSARIAGETAAPHTVRFHAPDDA